MNLLLVRCGGDIVTRIERNPVARESVNGLFDGTSGEPCCQALFYDLPRLVAIPDAREARVLYPLRGLNGCTHTRPDIIAGGGNEHPAIRGFIGVLQTTTVARALRNKALTKISPALDFGQANSG